MPLARVPGERDHGEVAMSHDEALEVQRRHEQRIMALPGVNAMGVKLGGDGLVLEVTVDSGAGIPEELDRPEIEGLPLVVARGRYELQ